MMRQAKFTALWAFPWDLTDEGLDVSLRRIARSGVQGISVAVSYHAGLVLAPHNPRAKVRILEDGAVYMRPVVPSGTCTLAPRISAWVGEGDPLRTVCEAANAVGLEVVGWMICNHNHTLGRRYPQLAIQNAMGDALTYALCPSQPDVQDYLVTLATMASRYSFYRLQLESYAFEGLPHGYHHEKLNMRLGSVTLKLLGLCFCPACCSAAARAGVDWERARHAAVAYLERALQGEPLDENAHVRQALVERIPGMEGYLDVQDQTVTGLVERVARACGSPLCLLGIDPALLDRVRPTIAEVGLLAYHATAVQVRAAVQAQRALVGPDMALAVGIEATPLHAPTREDLAAKIDAAWKAGANSLYCYNYGLMPLQSLEWLRTAL